MFYLECGEFSVEHGTVEDVYETTLGSTAVTICDEGYSINGSNSSECMRDGWNSIPSCLIQGWYMVT